MKKWEQFKLLLVDLDGTLYYQTPCRLHMIKSLLLYFALHLNRCKDLMIIMSYRSLREKWKDDSGESLEQTQYQAVANKLHVNVERVEDVINRWMLKEPLSALYAFRDENLIRILCKLRESGIQVVIYSDYPVKDKLLALNMEVDGAFYSGEETINVMKPSPDGIRYILKALQVRPEDAIMIGDRMEKDGMAAQQAGISYAILNKNKTKRKKQITEFVGSEYL